MIRIWRNRGYIEANEQLNSFDKSEVSFYSKLKYRN